MDRSPINKKIPNLSQHIQTMLENRKKVKFVESVEMQMLIGSYNPRVDKRHYINFLLPHPCYYKQNVCIIGDSEHIEEVRDSHLSEEVDVVDLEFLKAFNKNKKLIKKWGKVYDYLLCSETIIRKVPRIVGPALLKIKKFPRAIVHDKPLTQIIEEESRKVRYILFSRIPDICKVIGNSLLTPKQIEENLIAILQDILNRCHYGWYNIKAIHIKTTMGSPVKVY